MAGHKVLLLTSFYLHGIPISETAKILTVSTAGECLYRNISNYMLGMSVTLGLMKFALNRSCMCILDWIRPRLKEGVIVNLNWD